jgi:hypothetical protein
MQASSGGLAGLFKSTQSRELLELIGIIFLAMLSVLILVSLGVQMYRIFTRDEDSCPRCRGNDVRRSHYREGPRDWMMGRFGCVAMRCRNCHSRYYAHSRDTAALRPGPQRARE